MVRDYADKEQVYARTGREFCHLLDPRDEKTNILYPVRIVSGIVWPEE